MMNIDSLNAQELAYIGDSVYEVIIRKYNMNRNIRKVINLQNETIKYVRANYQASALKYLIDNNILTEKEVYICKNARNYKTSTKARHTDILTYKHATAFEALTGYLYLNNEIDRLKYIINLVLEECKC